MNKIAYFVLNNFVWTLIVIVYVVLGVLSPFFFTTANFENILIQMVGLGTMALGLTFVLVVGEIDLSVTSVGAAGALLGTYSIKVFGVPVFLGIIMILLFGAAVGAYNGFLARIVGVPSLIATLSTDFMLRGGLMAAMHGQTYSGFPREYVWIGTQSILGVGTVYITYILLILLVYVVLRHTVFGIRLFLVGANRESALLAGIREKRMGWLAFVISGTFAGMAGFLLSSRLNVVTPIFMEAMLLPVIAAPVIGGISLFGGEGKIQGVVAGTFLLQTISTGLIVVGVNAYILQAVSGMIIGIAAAFDALKRYYIYRAG